MFLRALRRRLRFGHRGVCWDMMYLCICAGAFFLVTSQLGLYSDARAIDQADLIKNQQLQPERIAAQPIVHGDEGRFEKMREEKDEDQARERDLDHRDDDGEVPKKKEKRPQAVIPVLRKPVPVAEQLARGQPIVEPINLQPSSSVFKTSKMATSRAIDGKPYPQLSPSGTFIPMRRIVHLDLKGAPYKPAVFPELFALLKRLNATGVMMEWEDMFPYTGKLATAVNGNAYSMQHVETILTEAKKAGLAIVPLVQTFAHLEWILKLEEFRHLRDDPKLPQVICIGNNEAWELIQDMIEQMGRVHQKFGIPFYHIGADEVFNMGTCNETVALITKHGGLKDRATLWHIARTAQFVKDKFQTTPLAWHDMLSHSAPADIQHYKLPGLLEPVIWSYAEDLDQYLPQSTWDGLKEFPRIWGSSAWKGADSPMRYHSNPMHYVKNHESWTRQFTRNYRDFEYIQGLFLAGWSRYDHMAILAETLPVGIPSLAMSMETIQEGRPLAGRYPATNAALVCSPSTENGGFVYGCQFPGRKVYELVNAFVAQRAQYDKYAKEDYEVNGWLSSTHAEKYSFSSPMYISKILPYLEYHQLPLERLYADLKKELSAIFFDDAVAEFLETYIEEPILELRRKTAAAKKILDSKTFQKRPFVKPKMEL